MMNNKELNILLRNNTGNRPKQDLIDSFVVRIQPFNSILAEIKSSKKDKKGNHLIIGQRGAGKTTLLYRIKYAIEDDQKMKENTIPIMFSEEQYNLMDIINLWESISEHLEDYDGFENLNQQIMDIAYECNHEKNAYKLLEKALIERNKKIIVFIENIDSFLKKIGKTGQVRLREILNSNDNIKLICSSTTYFEGILKNTEPFHDFFRITQLNGLNVDESIGLLNKLAEQNKQTEQIKTIIQNHPKRLESLRRLTDGNPRIISYLFQIFLDNENGKAITDLYILLDDITFLYKAELDQLSAQQQKIIDAIARNWDAISTKELSQKTNIDSKNISAILNTLEKNQIIERIQTQTKNNLYCLKDRFLNIWYLMRFGKKRDKENIIWLVRFFDAWCDKSELSKRIDSHIMNLKAGQYDVIAALDMGNVFLSCENVPNEIKYNLYQTTKSVLPTKLIKQLIISDASLDESIRKLVKQKEWDVAIEALEEIKSHEKQLTLASWVYLNKGDVRKGLQTLEELYEIRAKGDLIEEAIKESVGELAMLIGEIFKTLNQFDRAIYYYSESIKHGVSESYYKMGDIYFYDINDLLEAEKNFRIAIEHNVKGAEMGLAELLFATNRLEESEALIIAEIEKGEKNAKIYLAKILIRQNKIDEAILIYNQAINDGEAEAVLNLGKLYITKENPEIEKARELFKNAISLKIKNSHHALGRLYLDENKEEEAEKILLKGIEFKEAESAHLLAHIYQERGDWKKTEKFFVKSFRWGRISSLMCLADAIITEKKNGRKRFILDLFEENYFKIQRKPLLFIAYARLLLWDNQFENSFKILKNVNERVAIILKSNAREEYKEDLIDELTAYFILLISKNQLKMAFELFSDIETNYKQILKPVYYSLMNQMKSEYPNEYLKAGNELKETVEEINKTIEKYKILYK
jgi:TPR repeat protein